jgi:mRNA interferase MazF
VWWAELPGPAGRRPVVLLSRNEAYRIRETITVALVTGTIRDIPSEVRLGRSDGLPKPSVVNLDNLQTIRKSTLTKRIGPLSPEKLRAAEEALCFALGLEHPRGRGR